MAASRYLPSIGWRRIFNTVLSPTPDADAAEAIAEKAREQAPVLWLLGKVQSGKTSIVHAVTGADRAGIGAGFRPCTRQSQVYEFPEEAPVVRFLDTRGLGEVAYDPAEDLGVVEGRAHAVVAVARAMDPQQNAVLDVLRDVRERHPDWTVVLVQTCLHEGFPDDREHPPHTELTSAHGLDDLRRSLQAQREAFQALPGHAPVRMVAVDLTRPEEGFADPAYGIEPLLDALDEACSEGRATLIRDIARAGRDSRQAQAHPHILGYATAAGVSDLVPVMGFLTVPTLQGKMLHSISSLYGVAWDRRALREFAASLGSGTAIGIAASFSARQLVKLVPVYGQVVGAAAAGTASAAVTYALGRAACYYLDRVRRGERDPEGVASTYRGGLKEAYALFRRRADATNTDREADGSS